MSYGSDIAIIVKTALDLYVASLPDPKSTNYDRLLGFSAYFNGFTKSVYHQAPVLDKDLNAPPAAIEGDRYIIATGGLGAWAGKDKYITEYISGSWVFTTPYTNMECWVTDENLFYYYAGGAWTPMVKTDVLAAPVELVNTNPGDTNRHEIDCSAYVPAGYRKCALSVIFRSTTANRRLDLYDAAAVGNSQYRCYTQVANQEYDTGCVIVLDSNRKFWWVVNNTDVDLLIINFITWII